MINTLNFMFLSHAHAFNYEKHIFMFMYLH